VEYLEFRFEDGGAALTSIGAGKGELVALRR
jgi:hypothetical protein